MVCTCDRVEAARRPGCSATLAVPLISLLFLLLSSARAEAIERRVPSEDYPTIQSAIDAALPGDRVLVARGVYDENIDFLGKAIQVDSESGMLVTVIDGGGRDSVVRFVSGEPIQARLRGFTLRNGVVGVEIRDSAPTVRVNVITDNAGPGVLVTGGGPVVEVNWIHGNGDSGVSIDSSNALVRDNYIERNAASLGGGVQVRGSRSSRIENNMITLNSAGAGGGIEVFDGKNTLIRNNQIVANQAADGGGIRLRAAASASIVGNVIADNEANSGGGIAWLLFDGGAPTVVSNTIANNRASQGSGITADGLDDRVEAVNNLIIASPGQTALLCLGLVPELRANDIFAPGGVDSQGCMGGTAGNLSADPLFADPLAGDYHLMPGSPAIDAGDNDAPELLNTDFDGEDRIMDGDGDGVQRIDIGADETLPAMLGLEPPLAFLAPGELHAVEATVTGGAPSGLTVAFSIEDGPNAGRVGSCDPADCTSDADGAVSFLYSGDGGPGVDEIVAELVDDPAVRADPVLAFWDADCDENGIPDTCDVSCGGFAGRCEAFACGANPAAPDACNGPPVADAGDDRVVACRDGGAEVELDGTGSYDPDGDPLSFLWTGKGVAASGPTPEVELAAGSHAISLAVADGRGGMDADEVQIRVTDGEPPEIEASLRPKFSWLRSLQRVSFRCRDACDDHPEVRATFGSDVVHSGDLVWVGSTGHHRWGWGWGRWGWSGWSDDDDDGRSGGGTWGGHSTSVLEVVCSDAEGHVARETVKPELYEKKYKYKRKKKKKKKKYRYDDDDD